jgi:uncharacterized protein YbjT (DUF2867 family)
MTLHRVFVTGATGHMGRLLIPELIRAGHTVRALVRPGSESRVPRGPESILGSVFDPRSYADRIAPFDTFVHLVGVSHPNPRKASEFRDIDLKSVELVLIAAKRAEVAHLVYVSVAQPAPVMKAYLAARAEAEALIRESGLNSTILRPWYVLGPGRRWPMLLLPLYWLFERIPSSRETAQRLGLVTAKQMIAALRRAVENPPQGVRMIGVAEIRRALDPVSQSE